MTYENNTHGITENKAYILQQPLITRGKQEMKQINRQETSIEKAFTPSTQQIPQNNTIELLSPKADVLDQARLRPHMPWPETHG